MNTTYIINIKFYESAKFFSYLDYYIRKNFVNKVNKVIIDNNEISFEKILIILKELVNSNGEISLENCDDILDHSKLMLFRKLHNPKSFRGYRINIQNDTVILSVVIPKHYFEIR